VQEGIVRKHRLAPPAAAQVYELTDWGAQLEPAVLALGRWASGSPSFPRDAEMGPDSLVLALKSTFDSAAGKSLDATYELVLDELPFRIEVSNGRFDARRGEAEQPDATIRTDPGTMTALVFRGRSLPGAIRARDIEIEGSKEAATRFVRLLANS
jgi:alkyl sulfatase BDS1-like metallo-beta-lactamase superfamily hydrolase